MTSNSTLPATGFLRLPEVLKLVPYGRSTWWAGVKTGRFPKQVKLGPCTSAWRVEDIKALIETLSSHAAPKPCDAKTEIIPSVGTAPTGLRSGLS